MRLHSHVSSHSFHFQMARCSRLSSSSPAFRGVLSPQFLLFHPLRCLPNQGKCQLAFIFMYTLLLPYGRVTIPVSVRVKNPVQKRRMFQGKCKRLPAVKMHAEIKWRNLSPSLSLCVSKRQYMSIQTQSPFPRRPSLSKPHCPVTPHLLPISTPLPKPWPPLFYASSIMHLACCSQM